LATGSYPGEREIVAGEMRLSGRGRVPWDAWLGPWGVMMVVVVVAMLGLAGWKRAMIERGWKG
jgi:hypothetical protein